MLTDVTSPKIPENEKNTILFPIFEKIANIKKSK